MASDLATPGVAGRAASGRRGWRTLGAVWLVLLIGAAAGAAILQFLGPPAPALPAVATLTPAAGPPPAPAAEASEPAPRAAPARMVEPPPRVVAPAPAVAGGPRPPGGPIAPPSDALLEPAPDFPGHFLPRTATGGRSGAGSPMKAYAGVIDPANHNARVAVLLAGMGMSAADSADAIEHTPAAVTLAFSPYAAAPDLTRSRALGHEFLISIPMEPAGYPLNDEGPQSLLTGASPASNNLHLEWILSRIEGYAGATGAMGPLRGERFANAGMPMTQVTGELQARGLYYIDPRVGQGAPAGVPGRSVDIAIDESPSAADIDTRLAALEHLAITNGTALGLAGEPRPTTVDRIAAWASRLATHGVVLVPVSAVLAEPAAEPPARSNAAE